MGDAHHLHRAKPRLIRPAPDHIQRQADALDAYLNRPVRKPEPSRGERITGAIAIALVGITAGYFAGHFFGGPF